jgi:hypothetical protein
VDLKKLVDMLEKLSNMNGRNENEPTSGDNESGTAITPGAV